MDNEEILVGSYRLLSELGAGAFGRVFLAQHIILSNRFVAIKLMHLVDYKNTDEVARFFLEPILLEELKHPHILPIIDAGIYAGFPYQVTEYAPKGSLRDRLRSQKPLSYKEAIDILTQIGQALQHAHDRNIIHRDLKPENILFNEKGDALLADFGIATMLTTGSIKQTTSMGTFAYMAPEEFQDIVCKESDQYALGCIAYELITGHLPFLASSPAAIIAKHLTENPVSPRTYNPQLPKYIEKAILKAMAKERSERHSSISAFIKALTDSDVIKSPEKELELNKCPKNQQENLDYEEDFDFQDDEDFVSSHFYEYEFDDIPEYCFNSDPDIDVVSPDVKRPEPELTLKEQVTNPNLIAIPKQNKNAATNPAEAFNAHGVALLEENRFQEALLAFEQALQIKKDFASAWCNKGDTLRAIQRIQEAMEAYKHTLTLDPSYIPAYMGIAIILLVQRQFDTALQYLDRAIQIEPSNAEGYCKKGELFLELHRFEEALKAFDSAIKRDAQYADAYIGKGITFRKLRRYQEAIHMYEIAEQLNPSLPLIGLYKGNVLVDLKRYEEALYNFDRALQLSPKNPDILTGKGNALRHLQRYQEALKAHEEAIRLDPGFTLAYINKGNVLMDILEYEKALVSFEQAIRLTPDYANAYYGKGNVLLYLHRAIEAL